MKSLAVVVCAGMVALFTGLPRVGAQAASASAPSLTPGSIAYARAVVEGYGLQSRMMAEPIIASPSVAEADKEHLRALLKTLNDGLKDAAAGLTDPPTPEQMQAAVAKAQALNAPILKELSSREDLMFVYTRAN